MNVFLVVVAIIIFVCIFLGKVSNRLGAPVLLLFILLGMALGVNSRISLEMTKVVESLCSFALVFVMFYGGFGTRWSTARPVVVPAGILASAGVVLTAAFTGFFCHLVLHWGWAESFLMGATTSSTDAATVFSILRTRKLGLKNNTAPLLEVESGSNDPCSYILTVAMLSVLGGGVSAGGMVLQVLKQIVLGAGTGILIAQGAVFILRRYNFPGGGYSSLFFLAVALLSYGLPDMAGGNGYLSAYIVGIILGNTHFEGKKDMVSFFDGVTSLMQILLFFILGYMVDYINLLRSFLPALAIFVFITFMSRPLSVFITLSPFRKFPSRQMGLISFVGLRGAASIVFAIMTLTASSPLEHDIFDIVFVIVLLSIMLQGSLIPWASKKFGMVDLESDVLTTFSDFSENPDVSFTRVDIRKGNSWIGRSLKEIEFPSDVLATLIIRGGKSIVARGSTVLEEGDRVILCGKSCNEETREHIREVVVGENNDYSGRRLGECSFDSRKLVIMVRRGNGTIIPDGKTVLQKNDILMILEQNNG